MTDKPAPGLLDLSLDELLSTTRAVRKRLDYDRPVPRELVQECLDLAIQAPTGSNRQGWQWLVVEDAELKTAIAGYYRDSYQRYSGGPLVAPSSGGQGTEQMERVRDSSTYLAETMQRAPYLVIPLLEGRCEPLTRTMHQAGYWGSILPAFWNFMLAARARGLGTAWTTLHLRYEREVADLLGVPYDSYTQAGLTPLAFSKGTDFKPATRDTAEAITHWDRW